MKRIHMPALKEVAPAPSTLVGDGMPFARALFNEGHGISRWCYAVSRPLITKPEAGQRVPRKLKFYMVRKQRCEQR